MRTNQNKFGFIVLTLVATAAFGQEPAPQSSTPQTSGGWRRATNSDAAAQTASAAPSPTPAPAPAPAPAPDPRAAAPAPMSGELDAFGQPRGSAQEPGPAPAPQRTASQRTGTYSLPPELTVPNGTFVTVRIDEELSSNRNLAGDMFSGTLVKPIVVDGFVVAQRGQTIAGRVVETVKSGRTQGTARLGIELTELTLVDGRQLRFKSQFVNVAASGSKGRDVGAIAATTGIGALAGAAADNGRGAGIGAAAGAAVGIIGVLLTRGHASVIDPESVLTFRVEAPVMISTVRAPHAFQSVEPRDFEREPAPRYQARRQQTSPGWWGWGGPMYYPSFYGPSVGLFHGRGFGRGYGRGYGRGWGGGGFYGPGWWW